MAIPDTMIGKFFITFFASMVPVTELRAGIPFGYGIGLPIWTAYIAAVLGNIVPVPFLLIFLKKLFNWMKTFKRLGAFAERLEQKGHLKSGKVKKYGPLGLALFVAIPLPGTGGWTGSLVASIMEIDVKKATAYIIAGLLVAGVIVSLITVGVFRLV
jgi:uncharacterized membrane protein